MRLRTGQVGQRQLHGVADGYAQPRLAILREAKLAYIGTFVNRTILHHLEISLENLKCMSAEP